MPCVLIVEDHDDTAEVTQLLLGSRGYETVRARNGAEGLDRMRQRRPCLVLLDIMMPVMDGIEFRRRQQLDPELAPVPVVAFTNIFDCDEIERTLGVRCLPKTANIPALLDAVQAACGPGAPPLPGRARAT